MKAGSTVYVVDILEVEGGGERTKNEISKIYGRLDNGIPKDAGDIAASPRHQRLPGKELGCLDAFRDSCGVRIGDSLPQIFLQIMERTTMHSMFADNLLSENVILRATLEAETSREIRQIDQACCNRIRKFRNKLEGF
jgi:hypothetical protein